MTPSARTISTSTIFNHQHELSPPARTVSTSTNYLHNKIIITPNSLSSQLYNSPKSRVSAHDDILLNILITIPTFPRLSTITCFLQKSLNQLVMVLNHCQSLDFSTLTYTISRPILKRSERHDRIRYFLFRWISN